MGRVQDLGCWVQGSGFGAQVVTQEHVTRRRLLVVAASQVWLPSCSEGIPNTLRDNSWFGPCGVKFTLV